MKDLKAVTRRFTKIQQTEPELHLGIFVFSTLANREHHDIWTSFNIQISLISQFKCML